MKVSRREGVLLAALLIVVAATAYFMFFWQPLSAKQQNLQLEIARLETEVSRLAPWESKGAELRLEIENLNSRIVAATEEKELGVPLPEYLVMVEAAADSANLAIENTALQVTEMGGMSQLDLEGSYASVYRFLSILEEQDEALVLLGMNFASQDNLLRGQLQVRLFSGAIIGEAREGGVPTRSPFAPRK